MVVVDGGTVSFVSPIAVSVESLVTAGPMGSTAAAATTAFPTWGAARTEDTCCGVGRYAMELGMMDSYTEVPDGGGGADNRI